MIETDLEHGVGSCVITSALMRNTSDWFPGYYYGTDINLEAGKLFTGNLNISEKLFMVNLSKL